MRIKNKFCFGAGIFCLLLCIETIGICMERGDFFGYFMFVFIASVCLAYTLKYIENEPNNRTSLEGT